MKAIILAGGKGTRLAPYTTVFPKPLVPLGYKPIIDIILEQLVYYKITDVILSVGYLAELIKSYFQNTNGRFKDLNISYIQEKKPLGTAGSLGLIKDLDETFLVMNGDVLTSLNYTSLIKFHKDKKNILTIAMHKKRVKIDLGVVETNKEGLVTGYLEKPQKEYSVSMGVYVYEPSALQYIEPEKYLDFPDLVLRLIENGEKVAGYSSTDYWLDIGRYEDYQKAQEVFKRLRKHFLPGDKKGLSNYVENAVI